MIIGFTGYKGSGKDTAAQPFIAAGYTQVRFAGGLKAMLRALLAYQNISPETIERMIEGDLKERPSLDLAGRSPRHAMQSLGNEWGRLLMERTLWVSTTMRHCLHIDKVVITDVRYLNEVRAIQADGGLVIRIDRPGTGGDDGHESERQIHDLPVDRVVVNDAPTVEEFQRQVLALGLI